MDPRYTLAGVAVMLAVFAVSGVPLWVALGVIVIVGAGVLWAATMSHWGAKKEGVAKSRTAQTESDRDFGDDHG